MPTNSKPDPPGKQIFLVGALRSGTTMLRLMLDHHPDITFPSEFEYVTPMISDTGEFPPLKDYYNFLRSHRGFLMDKVEIDQSLDFPELCHSFLTQRQEVHHHTSIVGSTVHHHFSRLPFVWPQARYIKLIRDGRDVARSFIPMGWAGNVWNGVDHWIESEQDWRSFKAELSPDAWIEVRYEDLLEKPVNQLTRLCQFIGVPFRMEMLSYPEHTTYSAPDPAYAYQWKTKQSETDIRLLESKIGWLLQELGYKLSGLPPMKTTPLMRFKLQSQNKMYCWRFKAKRYGFMISFTEMLTRKLHLPGYHHQIKTRMNQVDKQHLK